MNKLSKKIIFLAALMGFSFGGNVIVNAEDNTVPILESEVTTQTFSLTFNVFDGEAISPVVDISSGTEIDLASYIPIRSGYQFVGWYDSLEQNNEISSIVLTEDTEVFAKWQVIDSNSELEDETDLDNESDTNPLVYEITYDLDGGTLEGEYPSTYTSDTDDFILINPVKEGYTFVGWTNEDGEELGIEVKIEKGSTGDKKFIALYEINKYEVVFVDSIIDSEQIEYNEVLELEDYNPLKDGYVFDGWYDSDDYSNKITNVLVKDNTKIYAKWLKKVKVVVNYYNNNGVKINESKEVESIEGNEYHESYVSISGYVLNDNRLPENENGILSNDDVIVNYYYNKLLHINFDVNDGSLVSSMSNVVEDTKVDLTNVKSEKDGYEFAGWYKDSNYTEKVNEVVIKDNLILYAKWLKKVKLINNYYYDGYGNSISVSQSYNYLEGDSYSTSAIIINGYKLKNTIGSVSGIFEKDDIIVNYYYDKVYSLAFYSNGGSSVNTIWNIDYNSIINLNNYVSSRNGYEFVGWYIGNEKLDSILINENKKVYAEWKVIDYSINYELNGGSVEGNPNKYNILTDDFTLINPVKQGYTFIGWSDSSGNDLGLVNIILKGSTGDKSYVALYRINKYTLSFDNCNLDSKTYDYNTIVDLANYKPEKDGYIFDGWYKDEGLKDKVEAIMVTDDITLYAKWKMNLANEVRNPDTSDGMNIYIILLFFASLLVLVVTIVQKYFFYE